MPPPIPRCSNWPYSSLNSPSCFSLPRYGSRVGLHIFLFEAYSTFTRVAACTLALSPIRDTLIEGFSHFVSSMTASLIGQLGSSTFRLSTIAVSMSHAGFSNRPVGVKHFQTIHHCSVDVSRGLALLFGIGTRALPSWDPRVRRNNLRGGLAISRTAGPSSHANSPHPSSREGHLSTARWNSGFLLLGSILNGFHAAAAAACYRVHRDSGASN